jgi:hypothetical protein
MTPRLLLGVAVACAATTTGVHADDVVTVGREARTALALVVYAQGTGAVVQDTRRVALPRGAATVRFLAVPPQLDPRSVSLLARTGSVEVLAQRFRHDLASPDLLLARWIGKQVELVETDRDLRTQVTPATRLAVHPTRVFQIGDRIVLDHPGRIQVLPGDEAPVLEPTLTWSVRSDRGGDATLEATYATTGLGWEADYVLAVAADERHADLTGWITIVNDSAVTYDDATIAVVAGEVHQVRKEPRPMVRALAMEAADAAPQGSARETQSFEYHRYDLAGRSSLAPGETTQVRLLTASGVPIEKRYVVEGHGAWHWSARSEVEEPLPVQARLEFVNDRASELGRLLPAGVVRTHARSADGRATFAGEDRIGHVAQDERIRLSVGRATDVVATRRQVDHRRVTVKPYEVETAAELRLRNHKKQAVTVDVRESIGGTWTVLESSHPSERRDATTLGFEVPVPAGGETVVRYRLQVGH